ncbi:hypothetical protein ACQEVX_23205 [Streptomyces syringium]
MDANELLQQLAELLGVDDPTQMLAKVRELQRDRKQALASAATAWTTVHTLRGPDAGEAAA